MNKSALLEDAVLDKKINADLQRASTSLNYVIIAPN
jgi:hypothetical protein